MPLIQRTTSEEGVRLIKRFEGCKLETYRCSAGILTVGFGHTGPDVHEGMTITQEEADELLRKDLDRFERAVWNAVRFGLQQHEFDSLVSFAFNVGVTAFKGSSLVNYLNRGMKLHAAGEFPKWRFATVNGKKTELPGLVARRNAEKEMFLGKYPQEVVT